MPTKIAPGRVALGPQGSSAKAGKPAKRAAVEGLRNEALGKALDAAIAGRTDALYTQLTNLSGLPGTRMNDKLAYAFAYECAGRGKTVDKLVLQMARMDPNEARGASGREFLPVCGILALALRAAKERSLRNETVGLLFEKADDTRFRVREIVPAALNVLGAEMGSELLAAVQADWADGYFHAASAVAAFGSQGWLETLGEEEVLGFLHTAYMLAHEAPPSARRYPGFKALVEVLGVTPVNVATRFSRPMLEQLERWAREVTVPELREMITGLTKNKTFRARYGLELDRVGQALAGSATPPRDPTRIIQGMRGRGRKRR